MTDNNHLTDTKDTKFQPGWKGGPGRPPKLKTQVKDFIKEHPYAVETLMTTLYEKGIQGDREAAMYIIDRIKGKPKVTLGMGEEDRDLLKGALVVQLFQMMDEHRKLDTRKALQEGVTNGQSVTKGADTEEGRALQE